MKLSPDQVTAVETIRDWWQHRRSAQFVLTGYAGTGKTTIIRTIIGRDGDKDRIPAIVGAPTGKAAYRLRSTGVPASTIHKLAYEFRGEDEKGGLQFDFKGIEDGSCLVVIDEASMVDAQVYRDLLSQGYYMLFVGDPGQLPPIGDSPGIMEAPDFTLSEIHRQKGNAALLDFAHGIRDGNYLPAADGEIVRKWPRWDEEGVAALLAESDVTLCYKNATRHRLNLQILKLKGLIEHGDKPEDLWPQLRGKTFKIVGLRNYPDLDLYNGTEAEFTLHDVTEHSLQGEILNAFGSEWITLSKAGFLSESIPVEERRRRDRLLADFGYCLTTHKSQGSEWGHVVVYDDTFQGMQHHSRWCYTAATRAKNRLTWVHNGPGLNGPKKTIDPA